MLYAEVFPDGQDDGGELHWFSVKLQQIFRVNKLVGCRDASKLELLASNRSMHVCSVVQNVGPRL